MLNMKQLGRTFAPSIVTAVALALDSAVHMSVLLLLF